ncbi:MAG: 4Fe-4S binding protein [Pseudomonadota bacterium]
MAAHFVICPSLGLTHDDIAALDRMCAGGVSEASGTLGGIDATPALAAMQVENAVLCSSADPRLFETIALDADLDAPPVLDLARAAGWSGAAPVPLATLSALMAEAALPAPPAKSVDVISEGLCLIVGAPDVTLDAARALAPYLSVTVLLPPGAEDPDAIGFDVIYGRLRRASGALGQFDVVIDDLQQPGPSGDLPAPLDGGQSSCDILLDLSGGTPLFSAHEKREGYLRADPGRPAAVSAAILAASHLTGTFEKPLYVRTEPLLCAHSRAGQTGCTRCLDLCPTGAITPAGDHVSIDPMVCAGCGACAAACPSGAVSYDAPPPDITLQRIQTLAQAARDAGMPAPRLLAHDAHGAEVLRLAAKHFGGLPADVIPLSLPVIGTFGHAEAAAALAAGFSAISVLPGPGADRDALAAEIALAKALVRDREVVLLDIDDPEALVSALATTPTLTKHAPVRPLGSRRQVARLAAKALNPDATHLTLPEGAPYGAVAVNTSSCTLCLSCVSLCPSGALGDNPDKPQLRFQEDACLQCGICVEICPEDAIALEPRLNLEDVALDQVVLNEEEPAECISCGKPFGSKATIDRITEKLTGHAMFDAPGKLAMIQMCDDCRVAHQVHNADAPFQGGDRPRPRTTEDYLSNRRDH